MNTPLLGIHHVTAIVEEPQENVDFFTNVLGLRLVKQTVNFDDPATYHLYYGDELGRPGTIITFFPWPRSRHGSRGTGQISAIAFAIPVGAVQFWQKQLAAHDWHASDPEQRAGTRVLSFYDPSGLLIELVEQPYTNSHANRRNSDIPQEAAIQGLFGVTLTVAQVEPTASVLRDLLGFRPIDGEQRYAIGADDATATVELISQPDVPRGQIAAGSVHHVAWRVADDAALVAWRDELVRRGFDVTPVRERYYFRSIYFREPGGVLFEIATDSPGFTADETAANLGTRLMLPPWLETRRSEIEQHLPPLSVPHAAVEESELATMSDQPLHADTTAAPLSFTHQFIAAASEDAPTLLLLHGTGGDEYDLLDLGRTVYPGAALLSPRGQVLEHGQARFFRRLAEGVFDLDDLRQRTHDLAAFVAAASDVYHFDPRRVIAVGYSNGANIAASLLLLHPETLAGAVLFHAMVPLVPDALPALRDVPVFLGAGRADPLIPAQQTQALAQLLQQAGAKVELRWEAGGHALVRLEVQAATDWLARHANEAR